MSRQLFHLHAHQTFSPLDGYGTPEQVAERLIEIGHTGSAITDHGNCYGHVPWQKAAKKAGLRPVFGCEFYITEKATDRTKFQKTLGVESIPHITILVRTQEGYENFIRLIERATKEGYYYKPRIDRDMIFQHQKGLTVLTGCPTGFPTRYIDGGRHEQAYAFIKSIRDNCESAYVECVAQPGYAPAEKAGRHLFDFARELGMGVVLTGDNHFPRPEDHIAQELMLHIAFKVPLGQPKPVSLPPYQYYCTGDELFDRARLMSDAGVERWGLSALTDAEIESALALTCEVGEACDVQIMQGKSVAFPDRGETSADDTLRAWMEAGLARRLEQGTLPAGQVDEYRARAEREYDVISRKGFSDYILAITDICLWAKSQNTLVMCRGSAGGSLLLWLLGASETNSIEHDLSFERFYDDTRPDPPDVDVDFETWMRPKVIDYIFKKYGADHCAQILSLSLMRAKVAVADTAAAMMIPRSEYEALAMALDSKDDELDAQIDDLTDPEILKVLERHPQLRMASRLMGQVRQTGIHAAGVLVSAEPLRRCIAVLQKDGPNEPAISSVDKHSAALLGLLKFDLLSVLAFDVVGNAARKVGLTMEDLYRLPFNDPSVYDLAKAGEVVGVFQLDGAALKVGGQIGLDEFVELYAASALCRPGAMDFVDLYKRNKESGEEFDRYMSTMDPRAAAIIKPTYGVVLYQEQMMAMARLLAGMDWPTVHKLRKRVAAASFNGHELGAEFGDPFINGCVANGISEREANHWWTAIKSHGIYSFNKSHCVTYAIVSYWMLWIKTYHPEAYYEAFLAAEGAQQTPNPALMKRLVTEFRAKGGKVQLISRTRPTETFTSPEPGLICGGWANVKGVGDSTAKRIVAGGPYRTWVQLAAALPPNVYGALFESGATGERPKNTSRLLDLASWFPVTETPAEIERMMSPYRKDIVRPGDLPAGEKVFGAFVSGYISTRTKKPRTGSFKGEQMLYTLEDETGVITARVSTKKKDLQIKVKDAFHVGDYVAIKGWWTGDGTLFVADFVMMRKWDALAAPTANK